MAPLTQRRYQLKVVNVNGSAMNRCCCEICLFDLTCLHIKTLLLSAAEGQRPRNYSSCCCSWIFRLVYALLTSTTVLPPFFKYFKSIHCCCCSWIFHLLYALSTSTTMLPPICLNILNLSIYLSIYIFSVNLSIDLFHSLNINL